MAATRSSPTCCWPRRRRARSWRRRRHRRPDRPRCAARDHEARSLAQRGPLPQDGLAMTSVAHAGLGGGPARVSFPEKIWRINWGLVLVLTAIAAVGFVALYSAAG